MAILKIPIGKIQISIKDITGIMLFFFNFKNSIDTFLRKLKKRQKSILKHFPSIEFQEKRILHLLS